MSTSAPAYRRVHGLPNLRPLAALGLLFIFLLGVRGLGSGFRLLGEDIIQGFFTATENPLVALFVGLLATTVVQSSSVTTSMIVGLVAAPDNPLPLANAIPMVMGANIGTTVTSTLVSLVHLGRRDEFERAFPIAVCHDIFNYLTVLVLLPMEITTGYLRHAAIWCAGWLGDVGGVEFESPLRSVLRLGFAPVTATAEALFDTEGVRGVFIIVVSGFLIFFALGFLVKVLRSVMHAGVERVVTRLLGANPTVAIAIGVLVTVMVQSSSITTSLLVPLGAAGLLRLEQAFPVTLGANIGTTVTGFLAALAVSGPNAGAGLEIALVHFLFNLSGLLLIYPAPRIRRIPLGLAKAAGSLAFRSRRLTVISVVVLFYVLPALGIAISQWWGH